MNKSSVGFPEGHTHYIGRIQLNNSPSERITLVMVMSQCKVMCAADGSYNLSLLKAQANKSTGPDEGK